MKIYRYDDEGVFLTEDEGYLDPEETKKQGKEIYMLPANSTFIKPPITKEYELAVFNNGEWLCVKNYKGKYICDKELNIKIVDYIGDIEQGYIIITEAEAKKIMDDNLFYIVFDGKLILNPNYEEEKTNEEKKRIGKLTITKRVFALALEKFGVTYAQLKEVIMTDERAQLEWDLCVELERSNPLLDTMAAKVNISPQQLDYIFKAANGEEV